MVFKFSQNARLYILKQYKEWKELHPGINITQCIQKLYRDITKNGLYLSSDTNLDIWTKKEYKVFRTKDAKWYFGGHISADGKTFIAKETLIAGQMADSAHNPRTPEHNNYHPQNPDFNSVMICFNPSKDLKQIYSWLNEQLKRL